MHNDRNPHVSLHPLNNIGGWVTHPIVPENITPASDVI
jgi:hypothetical protein